MDAASVEQIRMVQNRAEKAFRKRFHDPERDFYAYAFSPDGDHIKETSPWNCVAFTFDVGEESVIRQSLRRMIGASLLTDWGVRSISNESAHFSPLNYNYGAVWPFLNSWISCALFRHGYPQQGYTVLKATAGQTFRGQLGAIHEVFSGSLHAWPQESVSHQGFSTAGAVLPTVRGLLGLDGSADTLAFVPRFPEDWERVEVHNHILGETSYDLTWTRDGDQQIVRILPDGNRTVTAVVELPLSGGLKGEVAISGAELTRQEVFGGHGEERIRLAFPVQGDEPVRIAVSSHPTVQVLPVINDSELGDRNRGLKLLTVERKGTTIRIDVEGLAGQEYRLGITHPELVVRVQGARLYDDGSLEVTMPTGDAGQFVEWGLTVHVEQW
ncbi:hypothetical protein GF324_03775 [bacterium]|nr:hypothetical protein [bacterium]